MRYCWMSGLRRSEASTRAGAPIIGRDVRGLVKINPLAAWTDADVALVLEGMLRALDRAKHPQADPGRHVALRGFSWIVSPFETGGVVIALEMTLGAVVAGPFDIQGTIGREVRSYRAQTTLAAAPGDASDTTNTAGGGIGYRLGETARIGITIEFTRRDALNTGRSYDRRRIYSSVSYGF